MPDPVSAPKITGPGPGLRPGRERRRRAGLTARRGSHRVTLSVGGSQEDVDFHTRILGLRFIKRTVLFDGSVPVCHLYYANANGDPSSVITTFPWAQQGLYGKRGTDQAREVLLSVPSGSLDYWHKRLGEHGVGAANAEMFGRRRIAFRHPSGVEYLFVGNDGDPREGFSGNGVPQEHAIHGILGIGIHAYNPDRMVEFSGDAVPAARPVRGPPGRDPLHAGADRGLAAGEG